MMKIYPSLYSSNHLSFGETLERLSNINMKDIHIDIMDCNYVPSFGITYDAIKAIQEKYHLRLDCHLMVDNPEWHIDKLIALNVDTICLTYGTTNNDFYYLEKIVQSGLRCGVAVNPGTTIESLVDLLDIVDVVLVMSVNPGQPNQRFLPSINNKIRRLFELREQKGLTFKIQIDGGINIDNISSVQASGADIVVCGGSLFSNGHIEENAYRLEGLAHGI
ncbi:ribulose-phosphate 3-epimerase [Vibrio sp. E150_011]